MLSDFLFHRKRMLVCWRNSTIDKNTLTCHTDLQREKNIPAWFVKKNNQTSISWIININLNSDPLSFHRFILGQSFSFTSVYCCSALLEQFPWIPSLLQACFSEIISRFPKRGACLYKFGTGCYLSLRLLQPPTVNCAGLCHYLNNTCMQREAEEQCTSWNTSIHL